MKNHIKSLILIITLTIFYACQNNAPKQIEIPLQDTIAKISNTKYGFDIDNYDIKEYQLKNGELVASMFNKANISQTQYTSLLNDAKEYFDARKLRAGNQYMIITNKKDSLDKYMIYQKNIFNYVKFDFKNNKSELVSRKVDTTTRSLGASIQSNLWNTMKDLGVEPTLSEEMSTLFSWTIDFFGIQKDDWFKIVYEEITVDDTIFAGFGKIHTAIFSNAGKEVWAIPFKVHPDSSYRFFNHDGSSLKSAFLKAPLEYKRIASHFSNARLHPILRIVRPHHGVDYSAPIGTPVRAIGDGTIIHCQYSGGAGNYIKIRHANGYVTGYMHLNGYAKGISMGKRVSQGEVIGYVGSTGLSTGAHLDFRVWKNDQPMDPLRLGENQPPVDPVPSQLMPQFNHAKDSVASILNLIKVY